MEIDPTKTVKTMYDIEAYAKMVPYHVVYHLMLWTICSFIYFQQVQSENIWSEACIITLSWILLTLLFDVVAWVLLYIHGA